MAAVGLNVVVKNGTSYTVPTAKKAVVSAQIVSSNATAINVVVNGVTMFAVFNSNGFAFSQGRVGPVVFNAGDVLSCSDATGYALIGQLYDA